MTKQPFWISVKSHMRICPNHMTQASAAHINYTIDFLVNVSIQFYNKYQYIPFDIANMNAVHKHYGCC